MLWKVFNIETGATVKGGFVDEDEAKNWLEYKMDESADLDLYDVTEMDEDEELLYEESEDEDSDYESSTEIYEESSDDDDDEGTFLEDLTEVDDLDF
ncbi:MAG: hypothetical protein R3B45_02750 [Bdellovibrionota bacterium]